MGSKEKRKAATPRSDEALLVAFATSDYSIYSKAEEELEEWSRSPAARCSSHLPTASPRSAPRSGPPRAVERPLTREVIARLVDAFGSHGNVQRMPG